MNLNQDQQRRDEILRPLLRDDRAYGDIRYFSGLTAEPLQQLIQEQFADPKETQNNSPTIAEFLEFLHSHPTCTAHGYIVDQPRTDYRVSIEGLNYAAAKNDLNEVKEFAHFCMGADELDLDLMRSWWD